MLKHKFWCILYFPKVFVGHLGFKNGKLLLWSILVYACIRTNQKIKYLSKCFDVPVLWHLLSLQIGTELKSMKIYTDKKVIWVFFVFLKKIRSEGHPQKRSVSIFAWEANPATKIVLIFQPVQLWCAKLQFIVKKLSILHAIWSQINTLKRNNLM